MKKKKRDTRPKGKGKPAEKRKPTTGSSDPSPPSGRGFQVLVTLFWLLPALVVTARAQESFRLPKQILSEMLVVVSLLLLSIRLRHVERVDFRVLLRHPAILALLPLLLVATFTLATSDHPDHVNRGIFSLWIGAVALWGWSLGLRRDEFPRVLRALTLPALALSLIAWAQYFEWFEVFQFQDELKERISLTSLAGGAFDLSAYLVLPCLLAQVAWLHGPAGWRIAWGATAILLAATVALTQTLSAAVALVVGSILLWRRRLSPRRWAMAFGIVVAVALVAGLAIEPLRDRVAKKVDNVAEGDINQLLTGRLDAWRGAWWMLTQNPWTGVGQGAYRAEYGEARLALHQEGVRFYRRQHQPYFVNAHNEPLEVAAETGIPGTLALLFGLAVLARSLRRGNWNEEEASLFPAVLAVIGILALTNFPFRVALVGYPMILFVSWVFAVPTGPGSENAAEGGET